MKKKNIFICLLSVLFFFLISCEITPFEPNENVMFANSLKAGWNLGNTLDAQSVYSGSDNLGLNTETSWGMPFTTQAMINEVANRGFTTIRVPISWHNHIVDRENYVIDSAWMNRVKEIVDWALNANLKVIINIHHDNHSESDMSKNAGFCVSENKTLQEKSKDFIKCIWTQVGETFKSYDENLIFEVLNEPRCVGTSWEWNGGQKLSVYNQIISEYEQVALDAIRSTGEKNLTRYVMVPPYAASPTSLNGWDLPNDSAKEKLIVAVHAYSPYTFCMGSEGNSTDVFNGYTELETLFRNLYKEFVYKGIGVVMGETSATDKNNLSERIKWVQYYYKQARKSFIPVILWDNKNTYENSFGQSWDNMAERHGYFDRENLSWFEPTLIDEIIKQCEIVY